MLAFTVAAPVPITPTAHHVHHVHHPSPALSPRRRRAARITAVGDGNTEPPPTPSSTPAPPSSNATTPSAAESTTRRRRSSMKRRKTTAFDAAIENMTMKRMGRGTIYYGQRTNADDGYASGGDDDDDVEVLKPDAVLVAGATGRTGQWITLGLLNNGFNVRTLTRSFSRAEAIFGPSGANVDVFQADVARASPQRPDDALREAVAGCIAIVVAVAGPRWLPAKRSDVDAIAMRNLLDAVRETGTHVGRVVLVSDVGVSTVRGRAKQEAERMLVDSGIPYVIVRASRLVDEEGGFKRIDIRPVMPSPSARAATTAPKTGIELPATSATVVRPIGRVDLAQCVCQALVHQRRIDAANEADPTVQADFPSSVVTVENTTQPHIPNKRFWPSAFARVADAFADTEAEDGEDGPNGPNSVVQEDNGVDSESASTDVTAD